MSAIVAITTMPDSKSAHKIARLLVDKKLAACVTILKDADSIYRWKNKIQSSKEAVLLIKTARSRFDTLRAFIKKHHTYEIPEIIALNVEDGSSDYLKWLKDSLR